jgi:hypothetical protein
VCRFDKPLSEALPSGIAVFNAISKNQFGSSTLVEDAFDNKANTIVIVDAFEGIHPILS